MLSKVRDSFNYSLMGARMKQFIIGIMDIGVKLERGSGPGILQKIVIGKRWQSYQGVFRDASATGFPLPKYSDVQFFHRLIVPFSTWLVCCTVASPTMQTQKPS
jgi:hypothetical protein